MKTYKIEDIFRLSINLEEQGKKFYEVAAKEAEEKRIQNLFIYLARAEVKHAKTFFKLYKIYAKKNGTFPADERFDDFLDTVVRGLLFPDISEIRDTLSNKGKKNIINMVKIAMDIETNTIIFYQKIRELVRPLKIKEALNKIIKEEEKHLIKLKNLRLDLDPLYAGITYGKFF